jgi:hypothetical protein
MEGTPPALPAVGRHVATKWTVEGHVQSLSGVVVEHKTALDGSKAVHSFKVKYDLDKAECWHGADEAWGAVAADEGGDCDRGWELVNDKCTITLQPLTTPAKTSKCKHLARCNFKALAASRKRECPDCGATFKGARDLVVDEPLHDALTRARTAVAPHRVWQSPCGAFALRLASASPPGRGARKKKVTVDLVSDDEGGGCPPSAKRARSAASSAAQLSSPEGSSSSSGSGSGGGGSSSGSIAAASPALHGGSRGVAVEREATAAAAAVTAEATAAAEKVAAEAAAATEKAAAERAAAERAAAERAAAEKAAAERAAAEKAAAERAVAERAAVKAARAKAELEAWAAAGFSQGEQLQLHSLEKMPELNGTHRPQPPTVPPTHPPLLPPPPTRQPPTTNYSHIQASSARSSRAPNRLPAERYTTPSMAGFQPPHAASYSGLTAP